MDFSDAFPGALSRWSPRGEYLATVVDCRLVARNGDTLTPINVYTCVAVIDAIAWNDEATHILCTMYGEQTVQIWALDNQEWRCRINQGPSGLTAACWLGRSPHFMTVAADSLYACFWSHEDSSFRKRIENPKSMAIAPQAAVCDREACELPMLAVSRSGSIFALVQRVDCKDYVTVGACSTLEVVSYFAAVTRDARAVEFSPNELLLCILDSPLQFRVVVCSLGGDVRFLYELDMDGLGASSFGWDALGQMIGVGDCDSSLRLLNVHTRSCNGLLRHNAASLQFKTDVYCETAADDSRRHATRYVLASAGSFRIPEQADVSPVKHGVLAVSWSPDGRFVATRTGWAPKCLWIWHIGGMTLRALLIHSDEIKAFEWAPGVPGDRPLVLALVTGTNSLFLWTDAGGSVVRIPIDEFDAASLSWRPDGQALTVSGKDRVCVGFFDTEELAVSVHPQ